MKPDLGIPGLSDITEIGRGGSARVIRAYQQHLDRTVAVKIMRAAWDEGVQRRFERERRAMGRLSDHPGIVPLYETGETQYGEPYLMMPYYAKGSLRELIDSTEEPMNWAEATALIAQVAETIAAAHAAGIIHCDIKPANIMLHDNGRPKIADFGISYSMDTETLTRTGSQTFSPAYSPPEVFSDSNRTTAVDTYGLGATFFTLLAGHPPFHERGRKADVMAVINRVARHQVADLRATVPAPICEFVEHCMAKNPQQRPVDAAAFLVKLHEALLAAQAIVRQQSADSAIVLREPEPEEVLTYVAPLPNNSHTPAARSSWRKLLVLTSVGALALGALGTVFVMSNSSAEAPNEDQVVILVDTE